MTAREIVCQEPTHDSEFWHKQEVIRLLRNEPGTAYQEADDKVKKNIRDWVRSLLQRQCVTVTFVKADGTIRDMQCTLNVNLIPKTQQPKDTPSDDLPKQSSHSRLNDVHSLKVFDTEKQQWRSFRFERLQRITAEIQFA